MVLRKINKYIKHRFFYGCKRKKLKFNTLQEAKEKQEEMKDSSLSIYKCLFKDHYHLGHKGKSTMKKKNKVKKYYNISLLLIQN